MKNRLILGQGKPKSFRNTGAIGMTDFESEVSNCVVLEKVFFLAYVYSQSSCHKLLGRFVSQLGASVLYR